MKGTIPGVVCALLLATAGAAAAQTTNGTISGRVVDGQGLPVPGVTVTATSPNQQGVRETVTSGNGDYILTLLPSGVYSKRGARRSSQIDGIWLALAVGPSLVSTSREMRNGPRSPFVRRY